MNVNPEPTPAPPPGPCPTRDFDKVPLGDIVQHRNPRCSCRNWATPGIYSKWVPLKSPNPDLRGEQRVYLPCECAMKRFREANAEAIASWQAWKAATGVTKVAEPQPQP